MAKDIQHSTERSRHALLCSLKANFISENKPSNLPALSEEILEQTHLGSVWLSDHCEQHLLGKTSAPTGKGVNLVQQRNLSVPWIKLYPNVRTQIVQLPAEEVTGVEFKVKPLLNILLLNPNKGTLVSHQEQIKAERLIEDGSLHVSPTSIQPAYARRHTPTFPSQKRAHCKAEAIWLPARHLHSWQPREEQELEEATLQKALLLQEN